MFIDLNMQNKRKLQSVQNTQTYFVSKRLIHTEEWLKIKMWKNKYCYGMTKSKVSGGKKPMKVPIASKMLKNWSSHLQ